VLPSGTLRVHGVALGGAGFVDDAFEKAADGCVGEWAGIGAFGVR
jgi:hypothetical protein